MQQRACGLMVKQIHDALERDANNALRTRDLTMAQVATLIELSRAPEKQLPLKELEKILHVAQSTAAGIVNRLERKGLVESFTDAADRRIKRVHITSAGESCCLQSDAEMDRAEEKLLSPLTEAERMIFQNLLGKVCDALQ